MSDSKTSCIFLVIDFNKLYIVFIRDIINIFQLSNCSLTCPRRRLLDILSLSSLNGLLASFSEPSNGNKIIFFNELLKLPIIDFLYHCLWDHPGHQHYANNQPLRKLRKHVSDSLLLYWSQWQFHPEQLYRHFADLSSIHLATWPLPTTLLKSKRRHISCILMIDIATLAFSLSSKRNLIVMLLNIL